MGLPYVLTHLYEGRGITMNDPRKILAFGKNGAETMTANNQPEI